MKILPQPNHVLTHDQTQWMTRSLVYVRRRLSDGKALYVGAAKYGLERPLTTNHVKAQLEAGEVLEIYLTDAPLELEEVFLRHEDPLLNNHGPAHCKKRELPRGKECVLCGKAFQSRQWTAKYCSPTCRFKAWDRRYPRQRAVINA